MPWTRRDSISHTMVTRNRIRRLPSNINDWVSIYNQLALKSLVERPNGSTIIIYDDPSRIPGHMSLVPIEDNVRRGWLLLFENILRLGFDIPGLCACNVMIGNEMSTWDPSCAFAVFDSEPDAIAFTMMLGMLDTTDPLTPRLCTELTGI